MSHSKAEVVGDVFRHHYGHCFHYVPKGAKATATHSIPSVDAVRGSVFERGTCVVEDVSLRMNMFGMGDFTPSGRHLVDFLLADVKRAFEHPGIHTYVLAADMSCFGVEAKEVLQSQRQATALTTAAQKGVEPFRWDIDDPRPIVDINQPMPSVLAMQATPGVIRQCLFEAMTLIPAIYVPPNGKRLILHMEPRHFTNPASIEDFMPTDPTSGIVICSDRADVVEAARADMRRLAKTLTNREWRREARDRTTLLARSGCFHTIPLCVETSIDGVTYAPFRLEKMHFQSGEADLAIQRWVTYLYTGSIVERLVGTRVPDGGSCDFFEPTAPARQKPAGPYDFYVGVGGRTHRQCALVMSVDSDFFTLLTYTLAVLIAGHDAKRKADEPRGFACLADHAPLLLRGSTTVVPGPVRRGERRQYGTGQTCHELFDPAAFYREIVYGTPVNDNPLELMNEYVRVRNLRAAEKRKATLAAKKRPLEPAEEVPDDDEGPPLIYLPPVADTPDLVFERVASVCMFVCMLGNDYLAGLPGVPRRWAYFAFAEYVRRHPENLVRVVRGDDTLPAPASPLVIDWAVHERLLAYCYYVTMLATASVEHKPRQPIADLSYAQVVDLVGRWSKSKRDKVPEDAKRDRMYMRLFWILKYFTHGTTNIRHIIDPLEFGWEAEWRLIIV